MSNQRIIYTRPDGGVSVVIPAVGVATDVLLAKDVPQDATNVRVVSVDDIPEDRAFREAWRDDGERPAVNMPAARTIHIDRLRVERDARLKVWDIEWSKATAKKDITGADRAENKRQALRDMPQTVQGQLSAASTPDQLKAVRPAILDESP